MNLNFSIPASDIADIIVRSDDPMAFLKNMLDQLGDLSHAEDVIAEAVQWIMAHAGDEANIGEFEAIINAAVHEAIINAAVHEASVQAREDFKARKAFFESLCTRKQS